MPPASPDYVERVVVTNPNGEVIGFGPGGIFPPDWAVRGALLHSSDPRLPLNDRTPRLVACLNTWQHKDNTRIGVVETAPAEAKSIDLRNIPDFTVDGHRVTSTIWNGMQGHSAFYLAPQVEVSVDGELIGSVTIVPNAVDPVIVFTEIEALSRKYIERELIARRSRFGVVEPS